MKLITYFFILLLLSIFNSSFVMVSAQGQNLFPEQPPTVQRTILGCNADTDNLPTCVGKIATTILQYLMFFAIVIATLFLVWAGIEYIFKGGGEEGKGGPKTKIINAVIGLVIALAAWVIILALKRTVLGT